jgi:hypothetical protein
VPHEQVVSLHCNLDANTMHLINAERLKMMKSDALLVNAARGPVIDEVALVAHLKANPEFRAGLDVFEDEPLMKPGLGDCENAVVVPHIASATFWTRAGMVSGLFGGAGKGFVSPSSACSLQVKCQLSKERVNDVSSWTDTCTQLPCLCTAGHTGCN